MKNLNQKGSAVVILLAAILIVAIAGVGYFIYSSQNSKRETANKTDEPTESTREEATTTDDNALKIPDLGIKVNDPDNRKLTLHKGDCTERCDDSSVFVRASGDDDYFKRCGYAAGILETNLAQYNSSREIPGSYSYKRAKQIGDKYFEVFPGSNRQTSCKNLQSGDLEYEEAIQEYIANNIVAL